MSSTNIDRRPSERVDVCIIGAGVAGGITAYSLAQQGYDVVMLEAGPWFDNTPTLERLEKAVRPEHGRKDVWAEGIEPDRDKYTTSIPENFRAQLNRQRLKGVGGTTHHWDAQSPRLHEKDFNMQSRYGLATDWPINYDDLRSYYADAEAELGVAGGGDNPFIPREEPPPMDPHPLSYTDTVFQEVCDRLGIETHTMPLAINSESYDDRSQCMGYGTCIPVCPSGAKYTGDIHIQKAIDEGTRLIDQVPVQRLEHDQSGERVEAAVYIDPDGNEYKQTARQFVIASGGIETPRLLLLSVSEQYPDGLANSSGTVGRYFMFGPTIWVEGELDKPTNQEPIAFPTLTSGHFYDHEDPEPGSIFIRFSNADPEQPLERPNSVLGGNVLEPARGISWGDDLVNDIDYSSDNHKIGLSAAVEVLPRKENSISLNYDETDKYGNPVPHISFDLGPHAISTGEYAIEVMSEILTETGAVITNVGDPTAAHMGNHHKGTTRMGNDPDSSVVNSRLQTHDLENLWITSSSVFPTGGAVNPTLTIAALSLRAADHIAGVL